MDSRINVTNFFGDYSSNGKVEAANTWKRIEQLEEKLNGRRAENRDLHEHLAEFFVAESSNTVTNYVNLKEKLDSKFREINTLEAKLKRLRINVNVEREQIQTDMKNKLKKDEEREAETLQLLHQEIENRKTLHKRNVEHLNNELQLVQVTIDLEQDEMETKLRRELIDLNSKIWRQQNVTKEVQIKIDDLERRQQATMKLNDSAPSLEQQLHFFQLNQLNEFFEKEPEEKSTTNKNILDNTETDINKNRDGDGREKPDPPQQANVRRQTLKFAENVPAKIAQPQLIKSDLQNPNTPLLVHVDAHDKSYNVVYNTKQMISNEYKILSNPDCRGETTDKNPQNDNIDKDINISSKEPDGNYYTNQLTKEFSTSSFTAKSDKGSSVRKAKQSVQISRQHSKSEDNHETIPKWTRGSNRTRKIGTETSNYSSVIPLSKKSDPSKASMFAANKCNEDTYANNPTIQAPERNASKKRKLFNVNNLDYLEDLIQLNE